ncbi:fumarylacetoacetate hydrolase family protein [Rahnella aquatilis]|uniref:2-keto-4-pentenoate hydratase/2-oxohepta-3-ene-1,7-dioic acid hydratase n=1 Tax=Rahnella aquatilis (strain ATCC 33071 / DSM 4594 / JCM 1683 / NBRC 105701 / NCIMB 13365 / CIP 78.65) TaxID=745277 RepID=H2IXZ2_RAHAC|nr:fumarylacetoacetate hydrolase family protein [Rahnella aquatilis]AEX52017.1 2-keto-4-pentenoate hydratase/2-oxohepta-3-ene-1,7-dioic acid hydratase [Rahnella aquatilis CIP 78.65 = ATCC 33071]KFD14532.1 fumarylacetoacetate hydrolase [Rahnella aquatilis CIP 78.65 = ATCC 33071]
MYQHRDWHGALLDFPVNKVVCVGSNYADHIKEMGGQKAAEPVLFIKPETALCDFRQPIALPKDLGSVHHEVELAVLIGTPLKQATEDRVANAIAGYGLALDLTLRDLQSAFKQAGQPWEKAKGFDGSCPMSGFIPVSEFGDAQQAELRLEINGEVRQSGNTRDMLTPLLPLIAYMSRFFTLRAGDIILTGTPHGVGPLNAGDEIVATLNGKQVNSRVI